MSRRFREATKYFPLERNEQLAKLTTEQETLARYKKIDKPLRHSMCIAKIGSFTV
jgi:hypothetical protein